MSVCMDWNLILREREEVVAFADEIPREKIDSINYYTDPVRNVGYLDIIKK